MSKETTEKSSVVEDKRETTGCVCGWSLMSTTPFRYKTSCGVVDNHTMDDHYGYDGSPEFKFCPYCGSKISYNA